MCFGVFVTVQLTIHGENKIFMCHKICYFGKSFHRTLLDQTANKVSIPAVLRKCLVRLVILYSYRYELLQTCGLHIEGIMESSHE